MDFTYINDLAQGVVRVIENEKSRNQIFNITYGESRSIHEIAEIMRSTFSQVEIKYQPKDKLMPTRGTLSIAKAKELIGYQPQFPIEKGFARYIEWYKSVSSQPATSIHELPGI